MVGLPLFPLKSYTTRGYLCLGNIRVTWQDALVEESSLEVSDPGVAFLGVMMFRHRLLGYGYPSTFFRWPQRQGSLCKPRSCCFFRPKAIFWVLPGDPERNPSMVSHSWTIVFLVVGSRSDSLALSCELLM